MLKRSLFVLMAAGFLAGATGASAACSRYGTQIECQVDGRRVVIGTQRAAEPRYAGNFHPQMLGGGAAPLGSRTGSPWPFQINIQNFGQDASYCKRLGNETYCY